MGKHGRKMHLALCRVQCGRVYEIGVRQHRRKIDDAVEQGFDSVYEKEGCRYRLRQANLQLALPEYTMEVLVRPKLHSGEIPPYWSPSASLPFALVPLPVTSEEHLALKEALRPGGSLGGRDQRETGRYSGFRLKQAWRLEHPGLWGKYTAEKQNMKNQFENLGHLGRPKPKIREEMKNATKKLPAELDGSINEVHLAGH